MAKATEKYTNRVIHLELTEDEAGILLELVRNTNASGTSPSYSVYTALSGLDLPSYTLTNLPNSGTINWKKIS